MLVFSSIGLALRYVLRCSKESAAKRSIPHSITRASHQVSKRLVQSRVEGKATQVECRGGGVDYLGSCFKGPQGMEAESA